MGARPSQFRKGGGFLDGVDVTLVGIKFTDEFNGEPFKPGKIKSFDGKGTIDKPHTLNALLSFLVEGATEPTTTTLKVANDFDAWEISDDEMEITPNVEGLELAAGTAFAKLITSAVEANPAVENLLPADKIRYSALLGLRGRLIQRVDGERTTKFGQKKDKKSGKSYDRKDLVFDQIYELPSGEAKAAPKAAAKGKPAAAAKAGKPAPAAAAVESVDVEQLTKDTLVEITAEAGGSIQKSKLSMKVLTKLMKHPNREDVRKRIFEDDFLALEEAWAYDKAKGIITVVTE